MVLLTRKTTDLHDAASFDHEGKNGVPERTLGSILASLADSDPRIVAASADLAWSTFIAEFMRRHPSRFFQAGISERNMLGLAAGLAASGYLPFVTTFSAFASLQSLDVIRNDHAYTNLPVRTIGTHTGISMGYFASSHHAIEDLGALRSIPNLTVVSPADLNATEALIRATLDHPGPVYFRLGRGADGPAVYDSGPALNVGEPTVLREGADILIVTTGIGVHAARDAADLLAGEGGPSATVVDVHTIRPFGDEAIAELAARHEVVVVVEDHMVDGGLGTSVVSALHDLGVSVTTHRHGLRDFAIIGPPSQLYAYYGLDADGIALVAKRALDRQSVPVRSRTATPLWTEEDKGRIMSAQQSRDAERFAHIFAD